MNRYDLQKALDDVRRLKEDYNEGRNDVTSSDVWVAKGYLSDVAEKFLERPNLEDCFVMMEAEIQSQDWNLSADREKQLKEGMAALLFGFDVYDVAEIAAIAYYNFEDLFIEAFKKEAAAIENKGK
jgi:hypothetical protein